MFKCCLGLLRIVCTDLEHLFVLLFAQMPGSCILSAHFFTGYFLYDEFLIYARTKRVCDVGS